MTYMYVMILVYGAAVQLHNCRGQSYRGLVVKQRKEWGHSMSRSPRPAGFSSFSPILGCVPLIVPSWLYRCLFFFFYVGCLILGYCSWYLFVFTSKTQFVAIAWTLRFHNFKFLVAQLLSVHLLHYIFCQVPSCTHCLFTWYTDRVVFLGHTLLFFFWGGGFADIIVQYQNAEKYTKSVYFMCLFYIYLVSSHVSYGVQIFLISNYQLPVCVCVQAKSLRALTFCF